MMSKTTGENIDVGTPSSYQYTFEVPSGDYIITGYNTQNNSNGTIEVFVSDSLEQQITVITNTIYATNKHSDGQAWSYGTDYTLDVDVYTREGKQQVITPGNSTTAGRKTFLALNGNSLYASFIPSDEHVNEGYMPLYRSNTLTAGITVSGAIPLGADYSVETPANAKFQLAMKFTHFTPFKVVEPLSVDSTASTITYHYRLANGQVYNYRTWMKDGLTQAGFFYMSTDSTRVPELKFTDADYKSVSPAQINHDVKSNGGYETGDIFVNINPRGHLTLNVGETYKAHAMRTWQVSDNSTNNYFFEPDFHYTVLDMNGNPSAGVIEIDNADTTTDPWSTIKAVGPGEVIVLVTYDGINCNYYSSGQTTPTPYLGGRNWGAIWPENTAAYVVSVGLTPSEVIKPNMTINVKYNTGMLKMAGENIDAEHDILYYLDTDEGASYTFRPEGVSNVEIAYPAIGERMATYSGFGTEGVTSNTDGSYTILFKEGRNIVRLSDISGHSVYQVVTAKQCHREILNVTRPNSKIVQPGDRIKLQYSGLRHPANKLAGIYNMSAYVTYNGIPNGSSLILSANQYTFGSAASAQAVTIDIPADFDTGTSPVLIMNEGAIQVNGYGDPIGNHRYIDPIGGRSPNFTAVPHKTYFGYIPEVAIPVSPRNDFKFRLSGVVEGALVEVSQNGKTIIPDNEDIYTGTYGDYAVTVKAKGYDCFRHIYNIDDDASNDNVITFNVNLVHSEPGAWDGITFSEPKQEDGTYLVSTGDELAWIAKHVTNDKPGVINVRLLNDINLAGYDWNPIGGTNAATGFDGSFDGNSHSVNGLYINGASLTYQGLFGYVKGRIDRLTVNGSISGRQYIGGIAGILAATGSIDRCVNNASITSSSNYTGGIAGSSYPNSHISNCINNGDISGMKYCAGIVGNAGAFVSNCYSIGNITGDGVGACLNGSATTIKDGQINNVFCVKEYVFTQSQTLATEGQMASGEIAFLLGDAFGQTIGTDPYPVLGGMKVYLNDDGSYSNLKDSVSGISVDNPVPVPVAYYGIDGTRRNSLNAGINIVIYSDNTVKKIIVH